MLKKFNFSHVYDLQNSSRTLFYRRYLINIKNWSSSRTILNKGERKKDFENEPVLQRFKIQLDKSNAKTKYLCIFNADGSFNPIYLKDIY